MTNRRQRTELEQKMLDALVELSALFDNYPELYEMTGTYQVMNEAIHSCVVETSNSGTRL